LVTGDIADQDTDAVVTAAHWRLNKGAGTDGTIHTKGGPKIYEECRKIGGCPIGEAVITTGGNLKARHVIHAVGPVWRGGDEDEDKLAAMLSLLPLSSWSQTLLVQRDDANKFAFVTQPLTRLEDRPEHIAHRDIKPSNILITLQDSVAVPKVIDFGKFR